MKTYPQFDNNIKSLKFYFGDDGCEAVTPIMAIYYPKFLCNWVVIDEDDKEYEHEEVVGRIYALLPQGHPSKVVDDWLGKEKSCFMNVLFLNMNSADYLVHATAIPATEPDSLNCNLYRFDVEYLANTTPLKPGEATVATRERVPTPAIPESTDYKLTATTMDGTVLAEALS